jgi:hypothetical protein
MKITSEDQQVSSKVQETKNSVARRTVQLRALDCLVPHAGLSGAPGNYSPTASSWWHWWREAIGQSGVKACSAISHLRCQIQRLGALDRGTELSGVPQRAASFLQWLELCWSL